MFEFIDNATVEDMQLYTYLLSLVVIILSGYAGYISGYDNAESKFNKLNYGSKISKEDFEEAMRSMSIQED